MDRTGVGQGFDLQRLNIGFSGVGKADHFLLSPTTAQYFQREHRQSRGMPEGAEASDLACWDGIASAAWVQPLV